MQVARQKSQLFSCFDGRTGKNDPAYLFIAEGSNCHGHSKIGLTCTCRTHTEYDHFLADLIHIFLLSQGFRLDGTPLYGITDKVLINLRNHFISFLKSQGKRIIYILVCDHIASFGKGHKLFNQLLGLCGTAFCSNDLQKTVP